MPDERHDLVFPEHVYDFLVREDRICSHVADGAKHQQKRCHELQYARQFEQTHPTEAAATWMQILPEAANWPAVHVLDELAGEH